MANDARKFGCLKAMFCPAIKCRYSYGDIRVVRVLIARNLLMKILVGDNK